MSLTTFITIYISQKFLFLAVGLFIDHLTHVSSIECSLRDILTTGKEHFLHLQASGQCPSYEWHLLPSQSGLSPTPGQWWWSLGSSSEHVEYGASLHSCPVDKKKGEEKRGLFHTGAYWKTHRNIYTHRYYLFFLLARTYTSHPNTVNKSHTHTHNLYVCLCLGCMWSMSSSPLRVKKTCLFQICTPCSLTFKCV